MFKLRSVSRSRIDVWALEPVKRRQSRRKPKLKLTQYLEEVEKMCPFSELYSMPYPKASQHVVKKCISSIQIELFAEMILVKGYRYAVGDFKSCSIQESPLGVSYTECPSFTSIYDTKYGKLEAANQAIMI